MRVFPLPDSVLRPMDRAQVRHIAKLAELELSEEEENRLVGELEAIVAYVAELETVDVSQVPPTAHVSANEANVLRPDVHAQGLSHEDALKSAPASAHGGFSVPTFVE